MESWRKVFRQGIEPLLSDEGLLALKKGLEEDDPTLIQGATTSPPPLQCVQEWPVEAADAITYAYWRGDGLDTVGECEEAFARHAFACDQTLGEPAGVRHWLNWWDSEPRDVVFRETLMEVEEALARRAGNG